MTVAWRNKETRLWLIQEVRYTHTGIHKHFSETSDLNEASILPTIDYEVRLKRIYEPVEVEIMRSVTVKTKIQPNCRSIEDKMNHTKGKTGRSIQFRFFDKEVGEMEECIRVDLPNNTDHLSVDPKCVVAMQFTGMTDKFGTDIYEGDVVECDMSYMGGVLPHAGIVVYNDAFAAFATKNKSGVTLFHNHILSSLKVVGNIYENTTLAKGFV